MNVQKVNKNLKMLFWVFQAILLGSGIVFATTAPNNGDPTNNLKGATGLHDPSSVVKCDGKYYVYSTGGGAKSSIDRITWENGISIINGKNGVGTQSWWAKHGGSIWAPEVAFMDGVYYCFYSVSEWGKYNSAIGVATNSTLNPDDPTYKWVDKGIVVDSTQAAYGGGVVNVIDPGTFLDDDGKWYLPFGSYRNGCRMIELDRKTGKGVTSPPIPVKITNSLGEASFIIKWKTYYYYVVSRGGCCDNMNSTYQIVYGRGTSVKGPYLDRNGKSFQSGNYTILATRDSVNGKILHAGMGGQAFFWDNDTLFIDYHAYTAPSGASFLNIKPMYVDSEGWLTLNPAKGSIITRTPTSAIAHESANTFQKPTNKTTIRLIGAGIGKMSGTTKNLYTTTGKRYSGNPSKKIPAGVYFIKN